MHDDVRQEASGKDAGVRVFLTQAGRFLQLDQVGQIRPQVMAVVDRGGEHQIGVGQVERGKGHGKRPFTRRPGTLKPAPVHRQDDAGSERR